MIMCYIYNIILYIYPFLTGITLSSRVGTTKKVPLEFSGIHGINIMGLYSPLVN